MNIRIAEIEDAFKEVFDKEKGVVSSIETVYEKSDSEDYLKLILCLHGLSTEDISIRHTKFIFKTDLVCIIEISSVDKPCKQKIFL